MPTPHPCTPGRTCCPCVANLVVLASKVGWSSDPFFTMSVSESSSMPSQPSRSSPSTAARSPQKAAQPIKDGRCNYEPISPHAAFSLNRQPSSPQAVTFGPLVEDKPSERQGTPSDSTLVDMANTVNLPGNSLSKRKSQFYGEVFAYREPNVSARDRIHQFSIITVEVKTNVIVSSPGSHHRCSRLMSGWIGERRVRISHRLVATTVPTL